jgi:propionyl-CoA synthetase
VSAQQLNKTSIQNPNEFWGAAAQKIDWIKTPTTTLNTQIPHGRWFEDGKLNTAYNCLDRHIKAGRGSHLALVHDSAVTSTITKYTYDELLEQTVQLASVLRKLGVGKGDRVVIYMPNIPEAAISMLACARIGAIHSVVFGGFADAELATRIRDSKPKVILASSCGIENGKVLDYKTTTSILIDIFCSKSIVQ